MKKFIAAILCAVMAAAAFSGCGYSDALDNNKESSAQGSASSDQVETKPLAKASDFEDSYKGLCDYFIKMDYIQNDSGQVTKMDAALIGAKQGNKYATKYDGKQITIELYDYNVSKLNDKAKAVIDSVKKDGTFKIAELNPENVKQLPAVTAYISDSGKYLLIYTDDSIDKNNPDKKSKTYIHREEVIKNFKQFNK